MEKLIEVELRNLNVFYISCVNGQAFDTFQCIFLHYRRIECECVENTNVETFTYHNYEEFKNDRDILENILNKKGK